MDIKTSNIVYDLADNDLRIIDFGLASKANIGTVISYAPEVATPFIWYAIYPPDMALAWIMTQRADEADRGEHEVTKRGIIKQFRRKAHDDEVQDASVSYKSMFQNFGWSKIAAENWQSIFREGGTYEKAVLEAMGKEAEFVLENIRWENRSDEVGFSVLDRVIEVYKAEHVISESTKAIDVYCFGLVMLHVVSLWDKQAWSEIGKISHGALMLLIKSMLTPNRHTRPHMSIVAKQLQGVLLRARRETAKRTIVEEDPKPATRGSKLRRQSRLP
jgi:serine/threonine protein kinase